MFFTNRWVIFCQLVLSTELHRHAFTTLWCKAVRGVAGSCGPVDVWAEELPPRGQLAMALSLQAEALAATAKVSANSCSAVH